MRVALFATQAALPGDRASFARHVGNLARMLRFLGHECLLVGVVERPPISGIPAHAGGTRARLLQDVPAGESDERELLGLDALFDEERPDVVWLMQLRGARDLLRAARGRSIPAVADFHGLSCPVDSAPAGTPRHEGADDLRYVLAAADAVVAHMPSDLAAVEREGIGKDRVHLIPFGIEHDLMVQAAEAGSNGSDPTRARRLTIGFRGPLVPSGGAHVLLEALALAPDLPVRVRVEGRGDGDGEYEERLASLAAAEPRASIAAGGNGAGRVKEPQVGMGAYTHPGEARELSRPPFAGPLGRPERSGAQPRVGAGFHHGPVPLDLLVVPSLVPACPIVTLDAIAEGIPVVASDRSGVADLAGAPGAAEVFPAGDASALAAVLEGLWSQPGAITRLRSASSQLLGIEEEALEMERITRHVVDPVRRGLTERRPRVAARPEEPTRLVGGGIDFPHHLTDIRRTAVQLTGWALCAPQPVARVEVTLNGQTMGRARLGLARPVLLEAFSAPEAAVCGFEHWIDLTVLPDDATRVRFDVEIVALDGSRFPLSPIEVGLDPPRRATPEDVERARVLEERVQRFARPARRGRRAADANGRYQVRLLAFGHGLGYGGAQLYLFELLRRLAGEPWFTCTVVSPSDGPLRKDYEALGIAVHVTDFPRVTEVDLYEGNQVEFAAWMRNEGCNVVLGNTLLAFPWMDLAARLGIPSIWAIHESYDLSVFWAIHLPYVEMHPLVGERATKALGSAAALVFEADATRRMFEPFADARRLVKVDYGIDLEAVRAYRASIDRATLRSRLGIPRGAKVVLCLGAIEPRKSQTMLARAFRGSAAAHPEAFLALVGDMGGDYSLSLREYLEAAGLSDRSRVVPVVKDTYQWYAASDLFVLPSDLESLPRSVLEAMAFEVPVAAARSYGIPELIEDGRTGYLCEPRDLGPLSDMLERVLDQTPTARRTVGRAGARLVEQRHDSAAYAATYGRLMQALVEDPHVLPGDVPPPPEAPAD